MKTQIIDAEIRSNPGFAQGIIRLGLWIFFTAFTGISLYSAGDYEIFIRLTIFSGTFISYSVLVLISVFVWPNSVTRPYITVAMDVASICYAMILTGAGPFSPYFLLYPWIYISYAARYGRGPLFVALGASVLGFLIAVSIYSGWTRRPLDTGVYLIFLIILPFYINVMIRQLRWATRAAENANKAKSEFLATMSHEIRTPMSGVIGMASLLQRTQLKQEQKEYVDALVESASALHTLIDDVLDLSKIEAGKYSLVKQEFSLTDTIMAVTQMFSANAYKKDVELVCYVQPDMPARVWGDPNRLRQVLMNLTGNAVKFCTQGEISINATLCRPLSSHKNCVRFEVRDTGPGISADHLARIFEPFYQGDTHSTRQSGTGLGTTISRNLVELMNGEIGAESEPGQGTCFWFEIPFEVVGRGEAEVIPLSSTCRILLHDDLLSSRRATESYLNFLGASCELAIDGAELINKVKESSAKAHGYDLIIIADTRKRESAPEMARELQQHVANLPPLYRLTYIDRLENQTLHQNVFASHLTRPVSLKTLRERISLEVFRDGSAVETVSPDNTLENVRPLRVLIAEDSDINAKVLLTFLSQAGHHVTRVTNGLEALKALENNNYDFVLMDMRMPEMDGLDATRNWRKTEANSDHVPIVALTANATAEDQQRCLDAGMDGFLTKPVNPERLFATIKQYVTQES